MRTMARKICKKLLCAAIAFSLVTASVIPSGSAELKAKTPTLKTKKINVNVGKKKTISIKNKSSKYKYSFSSKNKKIAKVTAKGVVKGIKAGKTTVSVKLTEKKTKKMKSLGKVQVTVKKNDGKNITVQSPTPAPMQATPTPVPPNPTATPVPTPCVDIDFKNGDISMFTTEGEGVKIELSSDGYDDNACLKATGRGTGNNWFGCGMALNLSNYIQPGKLYSIICYVKCDKDATITVRSRNSGNSGFSFPSQVGNTIDVKAGTWTEFNSVYASPDVVNKGLKIYWDASDTADLYLDSLVIKETQGIDSTFKDTFSDIFGNVGTCNTYTQMRENKQFTTSLYNSVTMENEMKPQYILNSAKVTYDVPDGYIVPESYKDKVYLEFNFNDIDNVIKTAYEYGLRVRFHVLVWHSQTQSFFFRQGYNEERAYVTSSVMDGRLEYYITNIMKHIYETEHGKDVVYAWDVVNEYFHNYDKGNKSKWNAVYYPSEKSESDRTKKPVYAKTAFTIAHRMLEQYGLQDSVSLFYNDYNTYEVADDIIEMINYINEDGKVCDGVGMQSHLDVKYPTPDRIASTIDKFTKEGYEIQITELDVTDYDNSGKQASYYADLIKMLVSKKKAGADITGITFWGLCDSNSWRWDGKPLLFSALFCPKDAFYKVIEAAQSVWK